MGKLGIYLLANYPSKKSFIEAVKICQKAGVDFLEIGFPFSDPVADGDLLERACYETLRKYDLRDTLESFTAVRKFYRGRLYVMTYTNVVYSTGVDAFAERVGDISGVILADLPVRESGMFDKALARHGINTIRFLTPESREEDIARAVKSSRDFIYFVSKRGTTGGGFELNDETKERIAKVRSYGKEVFVGFGIRDRKDVELAYSVADGAIIGTRAVQELSLGLRSFDRYLAGLR
ncbi:MAG TPA: tryptophan synthase subunit alpha [Syntrophorhabdaceae bacterium]|nr:tryptophan synthase subunit alpha [Syntrophorhabdaceae bacterium]